MLKKTLTLACAGLLIAWTGAQAQNLGDGLEPEPDQSTSRVATRGANWLEIPVGARAQALGGAGTALIRGVEALAWNVGAIAEAESFSVGWAYSELFDEADISHQFAGAVIPLGDVSALGVSIIALSGGDIIRTSERFPEGGDPQFGETFEFTGFAAQVAFARQLTDRLNLGGALKIVSEGIDNARANWIGGDLGALFDTGLLGVTIGVAIQNIGGEARVTGPAIESVVGQTTDAFPTADNVPVQFDTNDLNLPTAFRFSAVFDVTGTPEAWFPDVGAEHNVRLVTDFFDSIDTPVEPSVGIEYAFKELVFGRIGKRFFNEERTSDIRDFGDGFALGGGIRLPVLDRYLGFDYAYTDMGLLDNIQTISINLGS